MDISSVDIEKTLYDDAIATVRALIKLSLIEAPARLTHQQIDVLTEAVLKNLISGPELWALECLAKGNTKTVAG